jgi:PAS domain S-box-containing protein
MAKTTATRMRGARLIAGQGGAQNVVPLNARPKHPSASGNTQLLNAAESMSSMGHWHVDLTTNDVTWSDALCAIFGVNPGSFVPSMDSVLAYCNEEDRAHVSQIISDASEARIGFEVDYRITRPDGQVRTIICKGQPEFDDSDQMVAMFGVGTDVTEAFDAIRSIQDQNEMLDLAAQLAHLGHWVWGRSENRISYCSDELASIHDMNPEEFAEQFAQPDALVESVVVGNKQRYGAVVENALAKGEAYEIEYRIQTHAGQLKDICEIGQPIFDQSGRLVRFIATVQDVTESKQRENDLNNAKCVLEAVAAALKGSEGKLSDVIEASIQGIVVLRDFRPVFANQAYADMLGAQGPDDILRAGDMREYIQADGLDCAAKFWRDVMEAPPGTKSRRTASMPTFDGRTIWTDTVGRRIEWDGEPAFLMIVIDVTERYLAEEELKNKTLELEELNQQKDKLFSIIAHDLKDPFNSIIGFSDLLARKAKELPSDKVADYAQLVRESAADVHELLDNLLAWAALQMRSAELNMVSLSINDLSNASVAPLFHMAQEKGVLVDSQTKDLKASGDESLVRIVLRNLVSNGIKFSHDGGVVKIRAEAIDSSPPMVRVSVFDDGVGMSEDTLKGLFDLNGAASKVGTAGESGTGLGLYLCSDIVARHGGSITVDSELGRGTSVHFTLPRMDINPHQGA